MRYFVRIAYDGSAYAGWQAQPQQQAVKTVQGVLEPAFSKILQEPIALVASGRTDAGVHAWGQVAHFDSAHSLDTVRSCVRLNRCLSAAMAVRALWGVSPQAHARYDARKRTYVYWVHTHKMPILNTYSYYYPYRLDLTALNQAAAFLLGIQDFGPIMRCQSALKPHQSTQCTVYKAYWKNLGKGRYAFVIQADRFLRGMVRACVGLLLQAGAGKLPPRVVQAALQAPVRLAAVVTAPARGLYLHLVQYPSNMHTLP